MTNKTSADHDIRALGDRLLALKRSLGPTYWQNDEVRSLQEDLRRQLGSYGAWSDDKLPMHQRARQAARYESEFAALLWPGRGDD